MFYRAPEDREWRATIAVRVAAHSGEGEAGGRESRKTVRQRKSGLGMFPKIEWIVIRVKSNKPVPVDVDPGWASLLGGWMSRPSVKRVSLQQWTSGASPAAHAARLRARPSPPPHHVMGPACPRWQQMPAPVSRISHGVVSENRHSQGQPNCRPKERSQEREATKISVVRETPAHGSQYMIPELCEVSVCDAWLCVAV
jgi:hypothetical protein